VIGEPGEKPRKNFCDFRPVGPRNDSGGFLGRSLRDGHVDDERKIVQNLKIFTTGHEENAEA
jgi:hypothetical protein